MRISDWSSDVCSSDLIGRGLEVRLAGTEADHVAAGSLQRTGLLGGGDGGRRLDTTEGIGQERHGIGDSSRADGTGEKAGAPYVRHRTGAMFYPVRFPACSARNRTIGSASCRERVCQSV